MNIAKISHARKPLMLAELPTAIEINSGLIVNRLGRGERLGQLLITRRNRDLFGPTKKAVDPRIASENTYRVADHVSAIP
jgi:hypothetical protein